MITIKTVSSATERQGIKALQMQNLRTQITPEEAAREGFVTAEYSPEYLDRMHTQSPALVALDGSVVAGYALACTKTLGMEHELLADLITTIDQKTYQGEALKKSDYLVVAQLCVAKNYRGIGLPTRLYEAFRNEYQYGYAYCLTDVNEANPRSLKAHLKAGFQVLDTLSYGGTPWHILLWDWRKEA